MPKKYRVTLTDEEQTHLETLTTTGTRAARMLTRARILLHAATDMPDTDIAAAVRVGIATVERIRKRCVLEGLEAALVDRPRPGGQRKLDAHAEATLVAWACAEPPDDRRCWTMQLLADKLIALGEVVSISDETVRRTLKKTI